MRWIRKRRTVAGNNTRTRPPRIEGLLSLPWVYRSRRPRESGDGTPSRPSKARGANIFASSRRDSNLEAFSRYPADVAAHHWPLGQVRAPEVRYCGSSRTEQGCYRENQSSGG